MSGAEYGDPDVLPPTRASCEALEQSQHPPPPSIRADQDQDVSSPCQDSEEDDSFDGFMYNKYLAY